LVEVRWCHDKTATGSVVIMRKGTLESGVSHSERDHSAAYLEGVGELLLQGEDVLEEDQRPELRTIVLNVDAICLIFDDCMSARN
jgi:hypothetical protein